MRYPTGLVHTIITAATPISDHSSQIIQIAYRNDTEAQAKAADIIALDRAVVTEDRDVLESTTFDTPVDLRRREEMHMASDQPGLLTRKQLLAQFRPMVRRRRTAGWINRPMWPLNNLARTTLLRRRPCALR